MNTEKERERGGEKRERGGGEKGRERKVRSDTKRWPVFRVM